MLDYSQQTAQKMYVGEHQNMQTHIFMPRNFKHVNMLYRQSINITEELDCHVPKRPNTPLTLAPLPLPLIPTTTPSHPTSVFHLKTYKAGNECVFNWTHTDSFTSGALNRLKGKHPYPVTSDFEETDPKNP